MSKVSENVLKSIEKNSIKPTCRAYFVAKETVHWFLYAAILLSGSLLFAAILELLFARKSVMLPVALLWGKILGEVPLYWFFALVFFLFAGLYVNRRTKGSYRYKKRIVLTGEILVIFLLGIALYFLKAGLFTCEMLGK